MSKTRRTTQYEEQAQGVKSHHRNTRTERLKEFEAEYTRKNRIPIITL